MDDARDPVTAEQLLAEGRALRALAQSLLGGDADDALQEGYVAALARPDAARRLGPWLAGTVRRLALRWRRDSANRRAREAVAARAEIDAGSDPARIAEAAETAAAVANAVRALDEPFRAAIVLRYWRRRSPEQIAAELGVPHNTVRSRLQRGLERLRTQLDAKYGERSRWHALLAVFTPEEEVVAVGAAGGGALLLLGVAMKTKLLFAAALLAAVAFTVPLLLDAPPAIARTDSAAAAPAVAAAATTNEDATNAPDREAAPVPPVAAAAGNDAAAERAQPQNVAPWLARFLVVDENEAPVDDATVTIETTEQFSRRTAKAGTPLAELHTDRAGAATAAFELPTVVAHAGKDRRRSARAILTPPPAEVVKLVLETPVVLRGLVRRGDGSPAAGALVTAHSNGFSTAGRGWAPIPEPATADDAGRFELLLQYQGHYNLSATLGDARTLPIRCLVTTRTLDEVELLFPGGLSLRGSVVDANGKPVPANVRAWREVRAGATRTPFDADDERAGRQTDAEGRFSIDVKKRARYEVIASADGYANSDSVWVETTAEQPHAEARLVLRSLATIRGVVLRGDGNPFVGVLVFPMLDGWNMGSTGVAGVADRFVLGNAATTGDGGRFTLTVDPGTPWDVVAQPLADNRWFRFKTRGVAPGRDDVVITIRDEELAGCVVRGDVLTAADAQPVKSFDVSVVSLGADGEPDAADGAAATIDGHRFELPPLPLGRTFAFDVRPNKRSGTEGAAFSHDLLAPVRVGPFTTTGAGLEVHARVDAWGELPVHVLAADGKPARDVFVFARRQPELDTGVRGSRRTDGNGRALLKKCVPGTHKLVVGSGDAIRHEQEVLITAGLNAEIVVRLPN